MSKKGFFITFEGTDGSGKSTQIETIANFLDEKGIEYIITREPGGTTLGQKLRDILLNYEGNVSSRCESFLFLADRAQHIDTKVLPAMEQGKIVLCDRHTDSSLAYQGYGRGLDVQRISMLNTIATNGVKPDLTLLYDVDTETASKRVGEYKDRMEKEEAKFHSTVRLGYLEIAKAEPQRIKVINSNNDIESVKADTLRIFGKFLSENYEL